MKRRKSLRPSKAKDKDGSAFVTKWRYLPLLVLTALSSYIAFMRLHTYDEPFERDITSHAVIAHEILAGRNLYSDLWDSKPPAIFVTYAVADVLVGYGPGSVYFLGVAAAVITLLGVYWAASAYGGKAGGLWAAAFWAVICSDLWLWANQPNIEVCINACLVWAFALIIRADTKKLEPGRWLAIGALFALATLYKPVAITFAGLLTCFHLLINIRDTQSRKLAFFQVCIVAAVGAAAWAAVFAYFAATDRFTVFYDTLVTYGRWYARSRGGSPLANILTGFSYNRFFASAMKSTLVLAVFAAAGTIFGLAKGLRRNWLLLLGFALAAYFAVALPGRFYPHYYQLWLGPLVIGAGWAVAVFGPKDKPGLTFLRHTAGAAALIILLCLVLPQYKFSADEWSAKKYGPQFVFSRRVVMEVDELLGPNETLYVLGINPEFYFWAKRKPPTGVIWSTDLANNPLAEEHTARTIDDLEREKPEMFVVNRFHAQIPPNHPILKWAAKRYTPLPGNPNRGSYRGQPFFTILIRRGGKLAARLGV